MTTDPEFSVEVVEAAAAPAGTPPEFRELIALALKTTDERVLLDAEDAYRGIFGSAHEYIVHAVGADPRDLQHRRARARRRRCACHPCRRDPQRLHAPRLRRGARHERPAADPPC